MIKQHGKMIQYVDGLRDMHATLLLIILPFLTLQYKTITSAGLETPYVLLFITYVLFC